MTNNITISTIEVDSAADDNKVVTFDAGTGKLGMETPSGGGAPTDATYIVQTANGTLSNEQALGALATGVLKNTTTTGVLSIATPGTDYYAPGSTDVAVVDGGTGASTAAGALTNLVSGTSITTATVATDDKVIIQDTNDSNNIKTVTAQSIADLGGGGGAWTLVSYSTASASATISIGSLNLSTDGGHWKVIVHWDSTTAASYVRAEFNSITTGYYWGATHNYYSGSTWTMNGSTSGTGDAGVNIACFANDFKSGQAVLDISLVDNADGSTFQPVFQFHSASTARAAGGDALEQATGAGKTDNATPGTGDNITTLLFRSAQVKDWKVWILKPNTS